MLLRFALVVTYLIVANIALRLDHAGWAATALALLGPIVFVRGMLKGHARAWLGMVTILVAAWALSSSGAALPVLMVAPSLFLAAGCWIFARTLLPGRQPLITRMAAFIDGGGVEDLPPAVRSHTVGTTWAWALLLGSMALLNLILVVNTTPGGIIDRMGQRPPWPVSPMVAASVETWGVYVPVAMLGIGEFMLRQWRFPGRYRNVMDFIQRARKVPAELFR